MSRFLSRRAAALTPYVAGEQTQDPRTVKLNTNECPYPPSPRVLEAIRDVSGDRLRRYPEPSSLELRKELASYAGLAPDQVFPGNGSDEILAFCFRAFFDSRCDLPVPEDDPRATVLFPDITYSFYPVYAGFYDIPFRTVPLDGDFRIPAEALCGPSAGVVLANPNAPTGIALPLADVERIVAARPDRLVVVDEAYVDFGGESALALLPRYDNLLVVQTFSKSRSLAGLRVGMAFGTRPLVEALERVRDAFNSYTMDCVAQAGARAALSDGAWFERNRARIAATRDTTRRRLEAMGFRVLPSAANFLLARPPRGDARRMYEGLKSEGILVRHFNRPRISEYLRISIGTDDDMDRLADSLARWLREGAAEGAP